MVSVGRDGPVHLVANGRTPAALNTASQSTFEVSFTMDVVRLAGVTMDNEVASSEGAVHDSLVSDMERDLGVGECAGEITPAVERCESDLLALVCHIMHHVPLYGYCRAR